MFHSRTLHLNFVINNLSYYKNIYYQKYLLSSIKYFTLLQHLYVHSKIINNSTLATLVQIKHKHVTTVECKQEQSSNRVPSRPSSNRYRQDGTVAGSSLPATVPSRGLYRNRRGYGAINTIWFSLSVIRLVLTPALTLNDPLRPNFTTAQHN